MDESKIVIIRSFTSYNEAALYKSILDGADIESKLLNETIAGILPMLNNLTEVHLAVRAEDEKQAKAILKAKFDKEEFEEESSKRRKKPF